MDVIVGDRTFDVHIRKSAQKLGIDCITTVKALGINLNCKKLDPAFVSLI